jgi:hypothetical protein
MKLETTIFSTPHSELHFIKLTVILFPCSAFQINFSACCFQNTALPIVRVIRCSYLTSLWNVEIINDSVIWQIINVKIILKEQVLVQF